MTPEQKRLVQTSFPKILPANEAAALFYNRLFQLDPSLQPMFKGDMDEQGRKLMDMLRIVVNGLDRLEQLVPAVKRLGERHDTYGVKAEHYATVGAALIWTLEQGLGEDFTDEVREAWIAAYTILANTMLEASAQLV